jgi:perosamine synthetase
MIPRQRLDIGWSDILYGVGKCFAPGDRRATHNRIASFWSREDDTVISIAERGSFDLILQELALPEGSEIIISALNIVPMFEVIERHNLVAVPVDLDVTTLEMDSDQLEAAVTPQTRAVLAAQLMGSRNSMDEVAHFARRHELFFFEDCAQAFAGDGYTGHEEADVTMFSFGPIKTCSTIMGGITRFKDTELAAKVSARQDEYAVHNRWHYALLLLWFALLKTFMTRRLYSVVVAVTRQLGLPDTRLNKMIRVFGGKREVEMFRHQPCYPLLSLLERRLKKFDTAGIAARVAAGNTVIEYLPASLRRPASHAEHHSYWLFPIQVNDPIKLMHQLRTVGFDSIYSYSTFIVHEAREGDADPAPLAREAMKEVLYLPMHAGMTNDDLIRMAKFIAQQETLAVDASVETCAPVEPEMPFV